MPSPSRSSPPDRMNLSRRARSFLPVAVLGFHSEAGWRANFSETAERMNSLRLVSGMRLRSDSGIFTVTACSVLVISKMYYLSCYSQGYSRPLTRRVRISDFSKTTTLGNWSADILVRSRRSVNPEADRNVRAGAGQNSSRAISNQGRAEVQGGRRDRWETPRASFIPAQGNALGSSAPKPISAESAIHPSSYQPPASHSASVPNVSFIELYEAGLWPESRPPAG